MDKCIVITTIHPKSLSIERFEQLEDWNVVVVGDRKSVNIRDSEKLTFLSVERQLQLNYKYVKICPYNHYARKNIGYLHAVEQKAQVIYDTDDDNVPYNHWGWPSFTVKRKFQTLKKFLNIYRYFSPAFVWPRGYPLDEVRQSCDYRLIEDDQIDVGVWQGLADLDPDVDAIYRLLFNEEIRFEKNPPVALPSGVYCPFNSQNTLWSKLAFAFLYLPATTSFRFTDILRGYIAQRLLWEHQLHLGFTGATVYQERNVHDLMHDFSDEIECYVGIKAIVGILDNLHLTSDPLQNLLIVYEALMEYSYVKPHELDLCRAWIDDLTSVL